MECKNWVLEAQGLSRRSKPPPNDEYFVGPTRVIQVVRPQPQTHALDSMRRDVLGNRHGINFHIDVEDISLAQILVHNQS